MPDEIRDLLGEEIKELQDERKQIQQECEREEQKKQRHALFPSTPWEPWKAE